MGGAICPFMQCSLGILLLLLLLLIIIIIIIIIVCLLLNESFSGRKPCQDVKIFIPNHQHTLKMGTEIVPEMSENPHILTQLSA